MKATAIVLTTLILAAAAGAQSTSTTCKPGAHAEKGKCVIDHPPVEPMYQRTSQGWEIFCPANTEAYRATVKPACLVGSTSIQAKPNSKELMCRSIGAQPAMPTCK